MSVNAYQNMFVPPTATVEKKLAPIGKYVKIDRQSLQQIFGVPSAEDDLQAAVNEYVRVNADRIAAARRPSGYMIGIGAVGSNIANEVGEFETTDDIALIINVLGRTVRRLYIPDRPLRFDANRLPYVNLFLKSEVYA